MLILSLLLSALAVLFIVRSAAQGLSDIDEILTVVEPDAPAKPALPQKR
jgi:hypothetical protein